MTPLKKQARAVGLLYLLAGLPAPFVLIYIPRAMMVPGDAAATADRVRASETLLRVGIAGEMILAVAFLFVALGLYRLLKGVSEKHAVAMVTLFAISVPISFLNVLNDIAALILVGGPDYLSAFEKPQLDALAYLFLRLHSQGYTVAQVFWGLWLFPFGILVMRSGFLPRILGILLILAGCAYVVTSFTSFLLPQYVGPVNRVATFFEFGELAMILWLLIWGVKPQPAEQA